MNSNFFKNNFIITILTTIFIVVFAFVMLFLKKDNVSKITADINSLKIKNNIVVLNNGKTKQKLINKTGEMNISIKSNGTELSDTDIIKTNDILKYNQKEHEIAVLADSNKDGNVDGADISRTYKIYRNIISNPTTVESIAADANEDDSIDGSDISRIYKIYRGIYNPEDYENEIEGYFLNTQISIDEEDAESTFYSNEVIIFKTKNNKIIMIDTSIENSQIQNIIYNKLKEISGKENVTIDYLIISHSHKDHYGNLDYLLTNPKITISNIIYKKEKFNDIVESKVVPYSDNINLIETSTMDSLYKINIDNITMSLFNLKDVYRDKSADICNKTFYNIKYSSSIRDGNIKNNNKYIYLKNLDPTDKTLLYSDEIENITNDLGLDENGHPLRRYYAHYSKRIGLCNANANSIAVLLEVNTEDVKKYIYIPSDLSNNGYSFHGLYNQTALDSGFEYGTIYSDGVYHEFENNFDPSSNNINNSWIINNNYFVSTNNNIKIASESRVANQIKNYLGENELENIVIYQRSHHGMSDAKDAIDTLNLNRSKVYSIALTRSNGNNHPDALLARGYYYTLNKTTRLHTGGSGDGVYCYIHDNGTYKCKRISN